MAIQVVNVKPIINLSELPAVKETYEVQWTIPDWKEIRNQKILVKNQKIIFETSASDGAGFSQLCQTKWSVGLIVVPNKNGNFDKGCVQWQLLEMKQKSYGQSVEATFKNQLMTSNGVAKYTKQIYSRKVVVGHSYGDTDNSVEVRGSYGCPEDEFDYIQANGSLKYKLTLILRSRLSDKEYVCYKMDKFLESSKKSMCENWTSLLNNRDVSSDLKIITEERTEIFVHRAILKAQCPVFARMLNSELSEKRTGVVKISDVSALGMNILLNYFYTGGLLPSWQKNDTIVEFLYASGKYQITSVLDLLDDVLGRCVPIGAVTYVDVQLLNLASKLAMPNAEQRLLARVLNKIVSLKGSQELFDLFGYVEDEIMEKAEILSGEKFGETNALNIVDDLVGNTEENQKGLEGRGLHLLALVQLKKGSLKNLEIRLLNRYAKRSYKIKSADELFEVFGHGKGMK